MQFGKISNKQLAISKYLGIKNPGTDALTIRMKRIKENLGGRLGEKILVVKKSIKYIYPNYSRK